MDRDDKKTIHRYWQNMIDGTHFIKGVRDSTTQEAVLASNRGNYFGPGYCYWARIEELPHGTYYVDGEGGH